MTKLHIAHLYPQELGINGDVGNVLALRFRAEAYGVKVQISEVHRGQLLPENIDLVHVGSGPTDMLELVLPDVRRLADELCSLRDGGVPFLAISAGWFALGRSITFVNGSMAQGAAVFPTRVSMQQSRAVGEVEMSTEFGIVTGFENHSSKVDDGGLPHFGSLIHGVGSDRSLRQSDRWDGVVMGSSLATNVHGPLLPMNPTIADALITRAIGRTNPSWRIPGTTALEHIDEFARESREAVRERL